MHAIIVITYRDRPSRSEHSWKTLLPKLQVLLLGDSTGRAVLRVQGDLNGLSLSLHQIWTEFAEDLEEAVMFHLSDSNYRVGPDTPEGLAENYSIPDIAP